MGFIIVFLWGNRFEGCIVHRDLLDVMIFYMCFIIIL